jgi:hypothetical protein
VAKRTFDIVNAMLSRGSGDVIEKRVLARCKAAKDCRRAGIPGALRTDPREDPVMEGRI